MNRIDMHLGQASMDWNDDVPIACEVRRYYGQGNASGASEGSCRVPTRHRIDRSGARQDASRTRAEQKETMVMDAELHKKPMFAAQVAALKRSALVSLRAAQDHCNACDCEKCDVARDALVILRLIATIKHGVVDRPRL